LVRIIIARSFAHISKALGYGVSPLSIITSALFALTSFFYIYTVGSYFKVSIYILQDRVTYITFFDSYIINRYLDHLIIASAIVLWLALSIDGKARVIATAIYSGITIIGAITAGLNLLLDIAALISIPIGISFLVYNRHASKKILNNYTNTLFTNYLAIIGTAISIISIIISAVPLISAIRIESSSMPVRNYAFDIFLLFSSFSPVFIFLLVHCVPVKLLMKEFKTGILKIKNKDSDNNKIRSFLSNDSIKTRTRTKIIYLSLFMMLSVTMVLIPHQPTINKDNQEVGTDTSDYVSRINILKQSNDAQEFIRKAFVTLVGGDRPITFIFLFTIVKIVSADPSYTIDFVVPMILGPALVLAVYFLTRELTSNDLTSLLSSFLTAVSFHTLIGIYAGFYANWFALIIGYLMFVFLIRFLKASSKLNFAIYSLLIVILLFSHIYTWSVLVIVIGVFMAVMFRLNYYPKKSMILLLLVALFSIVIDVARMTITGSASGIEQDISIANAGVGVEQFALRWSNLIDTTQIYLGSQFSNFIILMLGIYWLFRSNLRDPSTIFLSVFLSLGIIPLFFGDWIVQSRVLYNIPFQIPAAIALTYIKNQATRNIILLPIFIWLIAMSVRAVSNFYLILPS
jgi:hypothetical protein